MNSKDESFVITKYYYIAAIHKYRISGKDWAPVASPAACSQLGQAWEAAASSGGGFLQPERAIRGCRSAAAENRYLLPVNRGCTWTTSLRQLRPYKETRSAGAAEASRGRAEPAGRASPRLGGGVASCRAPPAADVGRVDPVRADWLAPAFAGCGRLGRPAGDRSAPPPPRRRRRRRAQPRPPSRRGGGAVAAAACEAETPSTPARPGPGPPPPFSPPPRLPSPVRVKGGAAARDAASVPGAGPRAPEETAPPRPRGGRRTEESAGTAAGRRERRVAETARDRRTARRTAAFEPACAAGRLRAAAAGGRRARRRTRDNTRAQRGLVGAAA
ncbi:atherin-like [Cricetulus griseus]|uniref:Atherin-like n=1 Tax=Cricetulus griseus TaxID=10029 RepID=A0A9J7GRJ0_CRIGR|nr:atherin-like [Cricetulus griseus]